MVGVGDGVFGAAERVVKVESLRPFGSFEGEEHFVDIAETVFTAVQRADLMSSEMGRELQDFLDGLIEQGVETERSPMRKRRTFVRERRRGRRSSSQK